MFGDTRQSWQKVVRQELDRIEESKIDTIKSQAADEGDEGRIYPQAMYDLRGPLLNDGRRLDRTGRAQSVPRPNTGGDR